MLNPDTPSFNAPLVEHALDYARKGLSVIPAVGKKPAVPWKPFQRTPADEATLRRLFDRPDLTGLAIVLGRPSRGLAARDFDVAESYHSWASAHPEEAASLPTVETARGFHVLGRLENETFADLGDGELRGDAKHYVVAPPSRHPSGQIYRWINPLDDRLPLLPPSLTAGRACGRAPQGPQHNIAYHACVTSAPVLDAIAATLPTGPGHRNRRIFDFVRRLKAIPDLSPSPPLLRALVVMWHQRALPVIRTKDFAETWSDFQTAWVRAKTPHGAALGAAYKSARRSPHPPIDGKPELGLLAALCRELAGPDGTFFLATSSIQKYFGVERMTGWRWLDALQFHGVIEQVSKSVDRQAPVWRYLGQ